jgi:zinc protease
MRAVLIDGVQRTKLDNGLTVLLRPDRRLPLACVLTWVNVGYFNEPDSLTGVSHFLEHLFFKGTKKRGVGKIASETKSIGGYLNASTIYDHTYYYTVVPARGLPSAIDIQSDALVHSVFDPEEMEKEKSVIVQELKRKYDNPDPFAWEKLIEMSFDTHRIRRWRMGTEEVIRSYKRDEVLDYMTRYYQPGNITVVIAGDFDPEKTLKEVERKYGELLPGKVRRENSARESVQTEPRMKRLLGDVSQALVKIGFQSPTVLEQDYYAMNFLSTLLGRGRSSRLYRALKEEKNLVEGVGTSLYAAADVGYFTIELETKSENLSAAEEEVWVELDRLQRDPPTADEIARVRNIVEANFFFEKENVMEQAYTLAYFESLGGFEKAQEYIERMRSVTPKDLLHVAEKFLTFSKMNLMEYVPTTVGQGAPPEQRLDSLKKRVAARMERAGPKPTPADVPPADKIHIWSGVGKNLAKPVEAISIGNGITLLHQENRDLPLASVAIYFPGGRLEETERNCGLTQFVLETSLKGTENRTADEIAFAMESLGSSIRTEANADQFGFSSSLLSRNLEKGMDILSDVILHPAFADREIDSVRGSVLNRISRLRDDGFRYSIELFYRALYGLHPYGLPRNGTEETVSSFGRNQLLDWHGQSFSWKNMVVAVVGDVERKRAIDLVGERFAVSRDAEEEMRAQLFPVNPARGSREVVEERKRKQTAVTFGFSGVTIRDDRYYALEVLRNILSGMGGRLFMELREKHALAYTVTAFNIALLRGGAFFTYIATSPEKEEESKNRLAVELKRAVDRAPTHTEMMESKAYTRGSHAISLQGNAAIAFTSLHRFMSGLELESVADFDRKIEQVTAEEVRRAATDVIKIDNAAIGILRGTSG